MEQIPVLLLIVVGVLAFGSLNADDKPASAKGNLAIEVLAGLPGQSGESVHQGRKEDEPLTVEGIEGVIPVRKLADILLRHQHRPVIPILIGKDFPEVAAKGLNDFRQVLVDRVQMDTLLLAELHRLLQGLANAISPENDLDALSLLRLELVDVFLDRGSNLRPLVDYETSVEVHCDNFLKCLIFHVFFLLFKKYQSVIVSSLTSTVASVPSGLLTMALFAKSPTPSCKISTSSRRRLPQSSNPCLYKGYNSPVFDRSLS